MKYAIQRQETKEFLREGKDSADAYTDDLGQAIIYDSFTKAQFECIDDEVVVEVIIDEDGGMSVYEPDELERAVENEYEGLREYEGGQS
ncbi:hypothetical protein [Paenibacillus kobensis]|uniref:hypothetical protein n=1 Tax=Paenibacillus kobensis TaxID=59841 RepID=UPI000FDBDDE6|nr:hypothetical protein [Paenibacillus kobensis]